MILVAALTLLALFGSAAMAVAGWGSPQGIAHIAFAIGILPLIFAAMTYFVPVLTRSGDPGRWIMRLPLVAQLVGAFVACAMFGLMPRWMLQVAAGADLLLAAILLNWIAARARLAIGSPHPGWRWYGVALGCLMMAMVAVLLMVAWPQYWWPLRLFHLHLNTLGLVGLAALGTLPVLLPTALAKPDPEAVGWLHRRLWLVAGGALVVATGTAVVWFFAAPGAALMLVAALGLVGQWGRRFGFRTLLADGVAASLLAAVAGLIVSLTAGVAHGAGILPGRPTLYGWGIGFLLPLVTGALTQLLPVWRWPGPQVPERAAMRQVLAAGGKWRALAFFVGALSIIAGLTTLAAIATAIGLALFITALLRAVRIRRSTR